MTGTDKERLLYDGYLDALTETVGIDDWKAISERAVQDAIGGNHRAREWLSKWLLRDARQLRDEGEAQGLTVFDICQAVEENRRVPVIDDNVLEAMFQALPDRTDVEAAEPNGDGG